MRYRVSFSDPIARTDAGIAATLAFVEPTEDDPNGELSLAEQVISYLKGIRVLNSRGDTADVFLAGDGSVGKGTVYRWGKRIGRFHVERIGDQDGDPGPD